MNPRRISDEELELLSLRWARSQPRRFLNNVNVDCFIAGFKLAQEVLVTEFGDFLIAEGQYYQFAYTKERIEACGYAGVPLCNRHSQEFSNAEEIGQLLEDVGIKYKESGVRPKG